MGRKPDCRISDADNARILSELKRLKRVVKKLRQDMEFMHTLKNENSYKICRLQFDAALTRLDAFTVTDMDSATQFIAFSKEIEEASYAIMAVLKSQALDKSDSDLSSSVVQMF